MKTITISEPINLKVVKFELDFSSLYNPKPKPEKKCKEIKIPQINCKKKQKNIPSPPQAPNIQKKREVKELISELLNDIYADHRDWASTSGVESTTAASFTSSQSNCEEQTDSIEFNYLETLDISEVTEQVSEQKNNLQIAGERLAKCLRVRDRLKRQQKKLCAAFTILLRHIIYLSDQLCSCEISRF